VGLDDGTADLDEGVDVLTLIAKDRRSSER